MKQNTATSKNVPQTRSPSDRRIHKGASIRLSSTSGIVPQVGEFTLRISMKEPQEKKKAGIPDGCVNNVSFCSRRREEAEIRPGKKNLAQADELSRQSGRGLPHSRT